MKPSVITAHGLTLDEYERARDMLGRSLTLAELGVLGAMWSEHCSYKSSKVHLRTLHTTGAHVIMGPGENAGVVALDDQWALAFKIESHNHPSFIEPVQGAATGIGGILRDVFAMGARPIALMNSLRFGQPEAPRMSHLVHGVVEGISMYGNAVGVPTVGGEWAHEPSYDGNILVNVFALGVVRRELVQRATAGEAGFSLMYFGSRTGRDGMHGATMASEQIDEHTSARRPAVQVGDPFQGKLLIEATLELIDRGLVQGVQDMGAAGLTSASVEMAERSNLGVRIDVSRVPRREQGMRAYDFLLSESQERMLAVIRPEHEEAVREVVERWELSCARIGEIIEEPVFEVWDGGARAVHLPVELLTRDAPLYRRPIAAPSAPRGAPHQERDLLALGLPLESLGLKLLAMPSIRSKRRFFEQFDAHVGLRTLARSGEAAASVMRVSESGHRIALTVECNARHVWVDPAEGAARAVAEAARNLSCVGATPRALTDCLNFGDPTHPEVMWEFTQAIEGINQACVALGVPVVSGNVSLYNSSHDRDILPTPVIAMVGVFEHDAPHCTLSGGRPGDDIWVLGADEDGPLSGSELCDQLLGQAGELPGELDLQSELALQQCVRALITRRRLSACQDCAQGGLFVALTELALASDVGVEVQWPVMERLEAMRALFGERPSRVILCARASQAADIQETSRAHGVSSRRLGVMTSTQALCWPAMSLQIDAPALADAYDPRPS